jgi:DtxR family Mn-dependent transcriptional regulator
MVKKLAELRLVTHEPYQGVRLTRAGEMAAAEVVRHHRLIEKYLAEALGVPWDRVHEEAEKLEHVISEDFEARIAETLGHPTRDPHGELIPSADLTMPADDSRPLASLRIDETATIRRVVDEDPALLRHLHTIGLIPEARITVKDYSDYDGNLTIKVEGQKSNIVLGSVVTSQVFVDK